MAFTAKDVATLRAQTGAGMMDCKKALTATDGDMDKAAEYLREQGVNIAAKKASRIASEGLVGAYMSADGKVGALAEINCESDFVANSDPFIALGRLGYQTGCRNRSVVARSASCRARDFRRGYGSGRNQQRDRKDRRENFASSFRSHGG